MTNYVKNYRKKDITKAYDLLELKANGRIDEDGDYLDDEGNKLTYRACTDGFVIFRKHELVGLSDDIKNRIYLSHDIYVETLENKQDAIHEDGFICVGVAGEKWCVRRDIFLATYEEVK